MKLFNRSKNGKAKLKTPQGRGPLNRTLLMEILLFVALGIFGFSAVLSVIRPPEVGQPVVSLPQPDRKTPDSLPVDDPSAALYEAPSRRVRPAPTLSVIFTPSVQYWKKDIEQWGQDYHLDPNLVATVMQIESCGNPTVSSLVGATGLFQVMPYHFADGEDASDPDTNALRGLAYLSSGLELAGGQVGLALAGYNGGHGVIDRSYDSWPYETQRYYHWGTGIYREASAGWDSSPTLAAWLEAGGSSLCARAEEALNLDQAR